MKQQLGQLANGETVWQYTLHRDGLSASILSLGASLQALWLQNHPHSLVLGYQDFQGYLNNPAYIGATIGRYANRIANAQFTLNDKTYSLDKNSIGGHHLHGGVNGSHSRNWQLVDEEDDFVTLTDTLPDGHMGYPGTLTVTATYQLLAHNTLDFKVTARTDQATLCNFTLHNYFNLDGSADTSHHTLQVYADHYLPTDQYAIPIPQPAPVEHAYDYRQPRPIATPLDHNFCLSAQQRALSMAASLTSTLSGIRLLLLTTEPGLQVYDALPLQVDAATSLSGSAYGAQAGIALEPQIWPDAPNRASYPSAVLQPEQEYKHHSRFVFAQI